MVRDNSEKSGITVLLGVLFGDEWHAHHQIAATVSI
jgi:hypothetical protein